MGTSRLGSLLVEEGLLSEADRRTIKRSCGSHGPAFARSIIALGLLDEDELAAFLAEKTPWRVAAKDLFKESDQKAWGSVDRPLLERLEVLPLRLVRNTLYVAMVDPLDQDTIKQLGFFTGYKIHPVISTLSHIRASLARLLKNYQPASSHLEDFISNHAVAAGRRVRLSDLPEAKAPVEVDEDEAAEVDEDDDFEIEDEVEEAVEEKVEGSAADLEYPDSVNAAESKEDEGGLGDDLMEDAAPKTAAPAAADAPAEGDELGDLGDLGELGELGELGDDREDGGLGDLEGDADLLAELGDEFGEEESASASASAKATADKSAPKPAPKTAAKKTDSAEASAKADLATSGAEVDDLENLADLSDFDPDKIDDELSGGDDLAAEPAGDPLAVNQDDLMAELAGDLTDDADVDEVTDGIAEASAEPLLDDADLGLGGEPGEDPFAENLLGEESPGENPLAKDPLADDPLADPLGDDPLGEVLAAPEEIDDPLAGSAPPSGAELIAGELNRVLLAMTMAVDALDGVNKAVPTLAEAGLAKGLLLVLEKGSAKALASWEKTGTGSTVKSDGLGTFVTPGLGAALTRLFAGWTSFDDAARNDTLKPFVRWLDGEHALRAATLPASGGKQLAVLTAWHASTRDDAGVKSAALEIFRKLAPKI